MSFPDPAALFDAAVAAFRADDFLGVARLCDPVTLRSFQRSVVGQFAPDQAHHVPTAEQVMQSVPGMPKEVADYQVAQQAHYADPLWRLQHELPGVASVEALRALDAVQVFAVWVEGRSPRRVVERAVAAGQAKPALLAFASKLHSELYDFISLGVVEDGPRVAYVLYRPRTDAPGPDAFAADVATLPLDEQALARDAAERHMPRVARCRRQADGTWLLYADYDFLSLGGLAFGAADGDATQADDPEGRAS